MLELSDAQISGLLFAVLVYLLMVIHFLVRDEGDE